MGSKIYPHDFVKKKKIGEKIVMVTAYSYYDAGKAVLVRGVVKDFGKIRALSEVSIEIDEGIIFSIGP